jgi:hypothetical protein
MRPGVYRELHTKRERGEGSEEDKNCIMHAGKSGFGRERESEKIDALKFWEGVLLRVGRACH